MHTITRGVIAAAALVGAAVGLAAPASAELTDGTYQMTYLVDPGPPETIVVTSCGAGCKHVKWLGHIWLRSITYKETPGPLRLRTALPRRSTTILLLDCPAPGLIS